MSYVPYHPDRISPQVTAILARISELFGSTVRILSVDGAWVQFEVPGWVDKAAMIRMEMNKERVLGADLQTHHITSAQNPRDGRGLWIRSVDLGGGVRWGKPGIWFY